MLSSILFIVFLIATTLLGKNLLGLRKESIFQLDMIFYLFLGILVSTILFLLSIRFGFYWQILILLPALAIFISIYKKNIQFRNFENLKIKFILLLGVLFALFVFPVFIQGLRMGRGAFPVEFYNVDSPFYLNFTHYILQQSTWPIYSLENLGFIIDVHYGVSGFCALLSKITGFLPHKSMFLIFPVLFLFFQFIVSFLILNTLFDNKKGFINYAFFVLLIMAFDHSNNTLKITSLYEWIFSIEKYKSYYPLLTSLSGVGLGLAWLYSVIKSETEERYRIAAILFSSGMVLFKIIYAPFIFLGYSFISLYRTVQTKNLKWLFETAIAVVLAFVYSKLFSPNVYQNSGESQISFKLFAFFFNEKIDTILLFLVPTLFLGIKFPQTLKNKNTIILLLCILPFIVLNSIVTIENRNAYQLYSLFPLFSCLLFIQVSYQALTNFDTSKVFKWPVMAFTILLIVPAILNEANYIKILKFNRESAHEYVDNTQLADALIHIPIKGSVIATNDLRYPADNYARNNRQFQISAIFGHQQLASNLTYFGNYPAGLAFKKSGKELAELLQNEKWDPIRLEKFLQKEGKKLTHLLIHKPFKHCLDFDLPVLYENSEFVVYSYGSGK